MTKLNYDIKNMRITIEDYIQYHPDLKLNGNNYCFKCKTKNMRYNPSYHIFHCFNCNKSFDIFWLVAEDYHINHQSFVKTIKKVLELYPNLDDSH